MPATNFYIALYEAGADLIRFPYYVGRGGCSRRHPTWSPGTDQITCSEPAGHCWFRHTIPNCWNKARSEERDPAVDWLGVPLKSQRGETMGVMAVQTYTEDVRLTEAHQDLTGVRVQSGGESD